MIKYHLKLPGLIHRDSHKRGMTRFRGLGGCIERVSAFLLFTLSSASCIIHSLHRGFVVVRLQGNYGRACANYVGGSKRAPPLRCCHVPRSHPLFVVGSGGVESSLVMVVNILLVSRLSAHGHFNITSDFGPHGRLPGI